MLFMVIERFNNRDPVPIYARLREHGRALPEGLRYVDSWVEANFDRCFQLMEATMHRRSSGGYWSGEIYLAFEIVAVSPSKTVREMFASGRTASQ